MNEPIWAVWVGEVGRAGQRWVVGDFALARIFYPELWSAMLSESSWAEVGTAATRLRRGESWGAEDNDANLLHGDGSPSR